MKTPIRMTALAAAALISGLGMTSTTLAESYQAQQEQFRQLDKNDDDKLELAELDAGLLLAQNFDQYDVDGSKAIELDEFYEYVKATRPD